MPGMMLYRPGVELMGPFSFIFFLMLVAMGVSVWRRSNHPDANRALPDNDPMTVLKLRLARGEITPDEYEELRAHLS